MAYRTVSFGQTYGSLGTVGYRLRASNGTLGSRVTSGVAEVVTGSGVYAADVDESSSPVGIVWDTAVSSLVVASEDFTERSSLGMASADLDTQLDAILAAAGSGGATAADVWSYTTRTLTGGANTYTGAIDPSTGAVENLIAGDAVTLSWTRSTTDYPTIMNGDATVLRFIPKARYRRETGSAAAEMEVDGTASISGSTITFSFSVTSTDSVKLTTVYPSSNAPTHHVQVKVPTRDKTPVAVDGTVIRSVAAEP